MIFPIRTDNNYAQRRPNAKILWKMTSAEQMNSALIGLQKEKMKMGVFCQSFAVTQDSGLIVKSNSIVAHIMGVNSKIK